MAWKTHGGKSGDVYKFSQVGQSIEGKLVAFRPTEFKFPLMILADDNGSETACAMSTGLVQCFEDAFGGLDNTPSGVLVRVRFIGLGKPKPGQKPFKRFELDVDEDTIPQGWTKEVPEGDEDGPEGEEGAPF